MSVYYSVVNELRILIFTIQNIVNVVVQHIFSSESLRVINSTTDSKFTTHIVFSMSGPLGFVRRRYGRVCLKKRCF